MTSFRNSRPIKYGSELESKLKKTRICRNWERFSCERGSRCIFAHGEAELRPMPNLAKTRMCSYQVLPGGCINPSCKFAHSDDELRPGSNNEESSASPKQTPGTYSVEQPASIQLQMSRAGSSTDLGPMEDTSSTSTPVTIQELTHLLRGPDDDASARAFARVQASLDWAVKYGSRMPIAPNQRAEEVSILESAMPAFYEE